MIKRTVTVTVSLSTNFQVSGRYFIDVRDTTGGANRQVTTRKTDDPRPFLREMVETAAGMNIELTLVNETI